MGAGGSWEGPGGPGGGPGEGVGRRSGPCETQESSGFPLVLPGGAGKTFRAGFSSSRVYPSQPRCSKQYKNECILSIFRLLFEHLGMLRKSS